MLVPRRPSSQLFLKLTVLWLCLLGPGWSQTHPWEPAKLCVTVERSDYFQELETRYQWETDGENYRSPRGSVSAAELNSLRDMVLESKDQTTAAPQPPSPQPAALVQRILQRFPWLDKEPFAYTAEELSNELAETAGDPIETLANSYTVQATLPGNPVLSFSLSNEVAPGQPASSIVRAWSVSDGRTEWTTHSPQLAVALAYLLKGTPHHDIVERVRSRNDDFLDRKAQSEGKRLASQMFAHEYRNWPGYAAVEPYLAEARLDFEPGDEAFYWIRLELKGLQLLRTAGLRYPTPTRPKEKWVALAADLKRAEAHIAETAWLRRALEKSAHLELRSPDEQDRAYWREAGLPGQPDFALVSSHGSLAEKFLLSGSQETSLLLFPTESTLQALATPAAPRPSYLLVEPNGRTRALELFL